MEKPCEGVIMRLSKYGDKGSFQGFKMISTNLRKGIPSLFERIQENFYNHHFQKGVYMKLIKQLTIFIIGGMILRPSSVNSRLMRSE